MSAQHPLRLPAAFATSAAIHAVALALVLRAVLSTNDPFVGPPEPPPVARFIKVSLVSRPGGGGGGPLPGLPSPDKGAPGESQVATAALPRVRLERAPPPIPQPVARPKPPITAPRLPGLVRFPTPAPPVAPKVQQRPEPSPAAPAQAPSPSGVDRLASRGTEAGAGGKGRGGGGDGTGDGSGGDGSDGMARPAYGANPKPPYPLAARRLGVEGVVMLEVLVRPDGSPAEVRVRTSSGSQLLDDSAVDTVRSKWRFLPARHGDTAIESRVTFPIRFRLDAS
jgi:protein TonB